MANKKKNAAAGDQATDPVVIGEGVQPVEVAGPVVEEAKTEEVAPTAPVQKEKGPIFRVKSRSALPGNSTAAFYFYDNNLVKREAVVQMIDGIVQEMPEGCTVDALIAAGFIRY